MFFCDGGGGATGPNKAPNFTGFVLALLV